MGNFAIAKLALGFRLAEGELVRAEPRQKYVKVDVEIKCKRLISSGKASIILLFHI
jgi:hypothetical protein